MARKTGACIGWAAKKAATGSPPSTFTQVMSGQVDIGWTAPPLMLDALESDRIRVLAKGDGSLRIAEALKLRADDASMRFASALVASADRREQDYAMHARIARAGARHDRLLALNVDKIAD